MWVFKKTVFWIKWDGLLQFHDFHFSYGHLNFHIIILSTLILSYINIHECLKHYVSKWDIKKWWWKRWWKRWRCILFCDRCEEKNLIKLKREWNEMKSSLSIFLRCSILPIRGWSLWLLWWFWEWGRGGWRGEWGRGRQWGFSSSLFKINKKWTKKWIPFPNIGGWGGVR